MATVMGLLGLLGPARPRLARHNLGSGSTVRRSTGALANTKSQMWAGPTFTRQRAPARAVAPPGRQLIRY